MSEKELAEVARLMRINEMGRAASLLTKLIDERIAKALAERDGR